MPCGKTPFKKLAASLEHRKGVENPKALAAYIVRKPKKGAKKMAHWASAGKEA